jgi:uncharacterized DUF497 family protein
MPCLTEAQVRLHVRRIKPTSCLIRRVCFSWWPPPALDCGASASRQQAAHGYAVPLVLSSVTAVVVQEDAAHSGSELRFHALGRTWAGRELHVTFTLRQGGTAIRVISARDMHRKERAIYEQASKKDLKV